MIALAFLIAIGMRSAKTIVMVKSILFIACFMLILISIYPLIEKKGYYINLSKYPKTYYTIIVIIYIWLLFDSPEKVFDNFAGIGYIFLVVYSATKILE
jgi:hypothetical protein